jgi:uncharacterized damage-inducible protein DinB
MKIADILLLDFDKEIANTRRTLERIPDNPTWKPHDKSMPIGRLAMHCATIPLFGHYIIEDENMDMAAPKRAHMPLEWKGSAAAVAALDDAAQKCRASLASATDDALMKPWRFTFGEQLLGEAPRASMFRSLFFDHMIHHTSQLGVYLRLLDIPVPALYGPSADEQWSPK